MDRALPPGGKETRNWDLCWSGLGQCRVLLVSVLFFVRPRCRPGFLVLSLVALAFGFEHKE